METTFTQATNVAKKLITTQNKFVIRGLILTMVILLGIGNAWAGGGSNGYFYYYYAKVTAKTATSCTGQGKVYVSTTAASVDNATSESSNATGQDPNNYGETTDAPTEAGQVKFYLYAKPASGYKFDGWSTSATRPSVFESTKPVWETTFGASTTQGSNSTTNPGGTQNSGTAKDGNDKTQYYSTSTAEYTVYAYFSEMVSEFTVSFAQPSNGSIKVGGVSPSSWPYGVSTTTGELTTTLTATPASGYSFWGWYTLNNDGSKNYLSYDATYNATFNDAATVYAEFYSSSLALFQTAGVNFYDLNLANAKAVANGGGTIVVTKNGTVPAGNYTIASGVTLLVPYDAAYTLKTTAPTYENNNNTVKSRVLFRQLTLVSGANITINGSLSVGGNLHARNGGQMTACVLDNYGRLHMENGSNIVLNGNLYCWGYITGNGSINAKSGSNVYEPFQMDFRGGTHCSDTYRTAFPMAQYYVQNIEAPITFHYGATETLFTCCYAQYSLWDGTASFIGSNGLFRLESGATLTRHYDGVTDRQCYDLYGNASIQDISVSVSIMKMASKEYILPINNNMILTIHSGKTTIYYDLALLPDSRIIIEDGATVEIKKNIYIYDKSDWRADETGYTYIDSKNKTQKSYFAIGADINLVPYSPTKTGSRTSAGLTDAHVVVNGTLKTLSSNGKIYTTTHGADICSDGGGKIVYGVVPTSTSSFKQGISTASKVQDIPVTSAQLHNSAAFKTTYGADFEYLATSGTAANTTITYANGHWGWMEIWKDKDGNVLQAKNTVTQQSGTAPEHPAVSGQEPDGWTTETSTGNQEVVHVAKYKGAQRTITTAVTPAGTGSVTGGGTYNVGATATLTATANAGYKFVKWNENSSTTNPLVISSVASDATYTAVFEAQQYNITYKDQGGAAFSGTQTDAPTKHTYGTATTLKIPTKTGYTFGGWFTASDCASGAVGNTTSASLGETSYTADITLYAKWTANTNTAYTVKHFKQALDGSYAATPDDTDNETGTTGASVTPAVKSYEGFDAPSTQTKAIAADGSMVIEYRYTRNSYTLSWVTDGDALTGTYTQGSTKYGAEIIAPNTPTKAGCKFVGWNDGTGVVDPVATMPAAAVTYTATFVETYTITWKVEGQDDVTTKVADGQIPEYPHETPTKAMSNQYTFTFEGWSNGTTTFGKEESLPPVTGPATYTAQFQDHTRYYTITWKNWNGDVLRTDAGETGKMQWGADPSYGGEPTRLGDGKREYTFIGWSPEVKTVDGDQEYIAQYSMAIDIDKEDGELEITGTETTTVTAVRVEGRLNVTSGSLTTTDLILEGSESTSGEIVGEVTAAHAYFELSHKDGFKAGTWYAVAVPWQVNVPAYDKTNNGVYIINGGSAPVRQELGSSFDLIYYDGKERADHGHSDACWKFVEDDASAEHIMKPGRAYMIYLTSDADVIRFERMGGVDLHTESLDVKKYDSANGKNAHWNGIANPATYHAYINAGANDATHGENVGQIYNADTKKYELFTMSTKKLVVGQPIFVQTPTAKTVTANSASYAPRRAKVNNGVMRVEVELTAGNESDLIIVRADDDKDANEYVVGQDLVKMGVSNLVPQMWIDRYDAKLCINTLAPINDAAVYPLGIFAPQTGEYTISINEQVESDFMLYLTIDGRSVWNLTYAPYTATLEQGTTNRYGLKLVRNSNAPAVTTGIQDAQADAAAQKIVLDGQVYILRGNNVYSVDGRIVK